MQIPALAWLLVASAGGAIRSYPFRNGVGGYHAYRIPSLIACSNGDLLLFCEGRFGFDSTRYNYIVFIIMT